MGSILRAVLLPSVGGDTCFASGFAAYEALSPAMKGLLDGMSATHDISRMLPPCSHPVVRTNPATGRKCLFVNGNWTARLEGLTERENDALLPMLLDHIRAPEFQC